MEKLEKEEQSRRDDVDNLNSKDNNLQEQIQTINEARKQARIDNQT